MKLKLIIFTLCFLFKVSTSSRRSKSIPADTVSVPAARTSASVTVSGEGEECFGHDTRMSTKICGENLICEPINKPGVDANSCSPGFCSCVSTLCCTDRTATCASCEALLSIQDYCRINPSMLGCGQETPSRAARGRGRRNVQLTNSDFAQGTFMALEDNVNYKLMEDIIFQPTPHFPNQDVTNCGNYCREEFGLGFFAVMAIDAENVSLNLNGFEMRGTEEFLIRQRFYTIIELGRSPFITGQGPGFFGQWISRVNNVEIYGGTLGLSSHHGIHGNNVRNVHIHDLLVKDFEVIGIQLNGVDTVNIERVDIQQMLTNVPFDSKLSHAVFLVELFNQFNDGQLDRVLEGINKSPRELKATLENHINDAVQNGRAQGYTGFFAKENGINARNPQNLHDGSFAGGITIRGATNAGVAVGPMAGTTPDASNTKGTQVSLKSVTIRDILLDPVEWVALRFPSAEDGGSNYFSAHGEGKGPFGDVIHPDNWNIGARQNFVGTDLSHAQIAACLFGNSHAKGKSCSRLTLETFIDFFRRQETFGQLLSNNRYEWVCNMDSMAHKMKGAVGMRLEDLDNLVLEDVTVDNIQNYGQKSNVHDTHCPREVYRGGDAFGMVLGNVNNIQTIDRVEITNIVSQFGVAASVAANGQLTALNFATNGLWYTEGVSSATVATEFLTCPATGQTIVQVGWGRSQSCPVTLCDRRQNTIASNNIACDARITENEIDLAVGLKNKIQIIDDVVEKNSNNAKIFGFGFFIFAIILGFITYRKQKQLATEYTTLLDTVAL